MRARAARAAALSLLVATAGCTRYTELLPLFDLGPVSDLATVDLTPPPPATCPVDIDVYGPADTLFPDTGGPQHAASPGGYFAPDAADYQESLAGRLQAALGARFGVGDGTSDLPYFRVRACGSQQEFLSSMSSVAEPPSCYGTNHPPGIGSFAGACTDHPGSLVILVAAEPLDRCHGGGADGAKENPDAYAAEFSARIEDFLAARNPAWVLIGGQTEWTPLPGDAFPDFFSCNWHRGDWSRTGLARFRAAHPSPPPNWFFDNDDLHSDFKDHSDCCFFLFGHQGKACEQPLWVQSAPGSPIITVDGRDQIAQHWIDRVRDLLAQPRFTCAARLASTP